MTKQAFIWQRMLKTASTVKHRRWEWERHGERERDMV